MALGESSIRRAQLKRPRIPPHHGGHPTRRSSARQSTDTAETETDTRSERRVPTAVRPPGIRALDRLLSDAMRATLHTDGAARHKTGEPTARPGSGLSCVPNRAKSSERSPAESAWRRTMSPSTPPSSRDFRWHSTRESLTSTCPSTHPCWPEHLLGQQGYRTTSAHSLNACASCSTSSRPPRSLACRAPL